MEKGGKWGIIGSPQAISHPSVVAALHVLIAIYHPIEILLIDNASFNKSIERIVGNQIPIQRMRYSPPAWARQMPLSRLKHMIRVMQALWLKKTSDCVLVIQEGQTPPSLHALVDELRYSGVELREINTALIKS